MKDQKTDLAEIRDNATDAGEWVNGSFEAIVRNAIPRQGKKPSKATLYDPANPAIKVGACHFAPSFSFLEYEGSLCRFGGQGTKAKLYSGEVEVNFSKNGTVEVLGDAPTAAAQRRDTTPHPQTGAPRDGSRSDSRGSSDEPPAEPAAPKPKVDPTTYFHRELAKKGLLWAHCFQYALTTQSKVCPKDKPLPPDLFQALVSTLFIAADRQGLVGQVPAIRELGSDGLPLRFVPPAPDAAALAAEKKKHDDSLEAQRKAWEAEQAAKAARAAAAPVHREENLDEDVPF